MVLWPRGVDTRLFHPRAIDFCLPRPVFLCVGRVAVEKNLEAFLDLDLPGTKVIVGDGPARAALARKYPQAVFLGARQGEALAQAYAAADVFVFPSKTDTFGLVLLEALASGLPVAAFPVTGPRDVIGAAPVGVLNEDLRIACLAAVTISPQACLEFAAGYTWEASARAFVDNVTNVRTAEPESPQSDAAQFAVKQPGFVGLIRRSSVLPACRGPRYNAQMANPSSVPRPAGHFQLTSTPPRACWRRMRCERRCCRRRFSTNAWEPGYS